MTDAQLRVLREVVNLGLEADEHMLLAAAKRLLAEVDYLRNQLKRMAPKALGLPAECTDPKEYD